MRKLTLLLLLLLAAHAQAASDLIGTYTLVMTEDAAWHRNVLVLDSVDGNEVRGKLKLDWGLGPEARAPKPDERTHEVPFEGRMSKSGGLHFEVEVGQEERVLYTFELYPVERGGQALVGVVTVAPQRAEISAGPWKRGVWAGRESP